MAELDEKKRKITVKCVYYGPALSGKTTNLMQLHDLLNPSRCNELMTFETKGDRTLFFDLLPVLLTSESGIRIIIKLFTVPGQVAHDATRKAVLSRADAVVFVADSQRSQAMSNFESFDNLEKNAARVGIDFENLPLVIQFNKRDLEDILDKKEIIQRWGPTKIPITFSSALHSLGVKETFESILRLTYRRLNLLCRLEEKYRITEKDFLRIALRSG
ncbi:MAG: GTPase domain-containing protein [Pseudomonadota bacterium]